MIAGGKQYDLSSLVTQNAGVIMKIVVLDGHTLNPGDHTWDEVAALGELTVFDRTSPLSVIERARDAEILLVNKALVDAGSIASLPNLRFISLLATGYDNVDVAAARERGIPVSNVPEYATNAVAQHVFALLLELASHVALHDRAVKSGEWTASPDFSFWKSSIVELAGLKMGIVGFGRIGMRVARIAHSFGMEVLAYTPRPKEVPHGVNVTWMDLRGLFSESDVISLNTRQTPYNIGFVNHELIALMKKTAYLINTARGTLVNEKDLALALNSGKIAGAALDVVSREPIQSDNPLLSARNCIITPHVAWASLASRKRLMDQAVRNIWAFLQGNPINVVN
jgi:glycerate dehydrogenase